MREDGWEVKVMGVGWESVVREERGEMQSWGGAW